MKSKNIVTKRDVLSFSVDTINLNVKFIDEESLKTIDDHWFISYKADNAKEDELVRTITLKPDSMKKNTAFLKNHLNKEEIKTLQTPSLSNLMKLINIFEKDKKIEKINEVRRIDFKFDLLKPYEDVLQMHKMLLLCHNYSRNKDYQKESKSQDVEAIPYKNNIIRTEGYLSSDKNKGRSILNNKGHVDICFYNKKKQLLKYFSLDDEPLKNGIESRLEYRFTKNNQKKKKSHREVIQYQLKRLRKMLVDDRNNFEKVETLLSKDILANYDQSNLRDYRSKLSNFLIAHNQDTLTDTILENLYNHSNLNGDFRNYFSNFKKEKYIKHPFVLVTKTQLIAYTALLRKEISSYLKS